MSAGRIAALAAAFPGTQCLLDPALLDHAAELAEGLDGRQLRKAVAAACAIRPDAQGNPDRITVADLLTVITEQGDRS